MNIVLFGAPGAGKGTQSKLLVEKLGMRHISTGDLFRSAIKSKTELGLKAKSFMDQGNLVPDEITLGMVEESLSTRDTKKGFILDGFPRNETQANALEELLGKSGTKIDKAIFVHVPQEMLLERLSGRRVCSDCGEVYHVQVNPPKKDGSCDKCGMNLLHRNDDQVDVIQNRLDVYRDNTAPLVQFYKENGLYVEVDGVGETEEVFAKIKVLIN